MLVRIFDIPAPLRTAELAKRIARKLEYHPRVEEGAVRVSFSPLTTSARGAHNVLITGTSTAQDYVYRELVDMVALACAPYFEQEGYLWYGCANPHIARKVGT